MGIFFVCPAPDTPAGGVQKIYRFVQVLSTAGFDASVVHPSGPRPSWIDTGSTPVTCSDQLSVEASDMVVVPEKYAWRLKSQAPSTTRVILNQGAYLTFEEAGSDPSAKPPYLEPHTAAAIVVSDDSRRYLEYAFPTLTIHRIRLGIDQEAYRPLPKKRQIAFMPRRRSAEAKQVLGILAARDALEGWSICEIEGVPPPVAGSMLGESKVFLSLPLPAGEGFPLPPLEAMSCACVVIGYAGRGGREYFSSDHSIPIEDGDIVGFARSLEEVLRDERRCEALGEKARAFVGNNYTVAQEAQDVLRVFTSIDIVRGARGGVINLSCMKPPTRVRRVGWRIRHLLD